MKKSLLLCKRLQVSHDELVDMDNLTETVIHDLLCVIFVAFKYFCSYQVIRLSSRKSVNKYLYLYNITASVFV